MTLTDNVAKRCGDMLIKFANNNGLEVDLHNLFDDDKTDVWFRRNRFDEPRRYQIVWNKVDTMSEACATIYADLMMAWGLNDRPVPCRKNTGACVNNKVGPFEINAVIFNDPATIVLWGDGTKTVVKCQEGDDYSKETGLALCIAKKALGNKGNFNEIFKKWIPEKPIHEIPNFIHEACADYSIINGIEDRVEKIEKNCPRRTMRDDVREALGTIVQALKEEFSK